MALAIPRNLRTKESGALRRHILSAVLARIDFDPVFGVEQLAGGLHTLVKDRYPTPQYGSGLNYQIDIGNPVDPVIKASEVKSFELVNAEEKRQLKFGATALVLEHFNYESFTTFKGDFRKACQYVWSKSPAGIKPKRIGLRKLNHFILNEPSGVQSFDGYFNSILTAHLSPSLIKEELLEDKHRLLTSSDGFMVAIQYGSDKGIQEDKPSRRYVLDIDVFSEEPSLTLDACMDQLNTMNDLIFDIFWWAIGDGVKDFMRRDAAE